MNKRLTILIAVIAAMSANVIAQSPPAAPAVTFEDATASVQQQLRDSLEELSALRETIAAEKIPLSRRLSELENELIEVRQKFQQTSRLLDSRTLDLSNLRSEIKARTEESAYLSNLLGEYIRNFESRLHIAELQRYREPLEASKLAVENTGLAPHEVFQAQSTLLNVTLERLQDALGGSRFEGAAVDANGLVKEGTIVLVGPSAIFRSADGQAIGTLEQRLGSLEPSIIAFQVPEDALAAAQVVSNSNGGFPLDPTLGNAHKIEATKETLLEHVKKGGPVMYPIFAIAGLALLVALWKWLTLTLVRSPSKKRIKALLKAVSNRDKAAAVREANAMPGPGGRMLKAGVEHLEEPRELVEEVMYETVLATRLKLHRWLPFIAITASSAPLLGLLGTVTGIMNTFTLMTVFGTGDVKTLSSGISEALITTEFGLYVAIPSLLLYAFLSRKARRVIDNMEKAAVALINQIGKTPYVRESIEAKPVLNGIMPVNADLTARTAPTSRQVRDALTDLLTPLIKEQIESSHAHTRRMHAHAAAGEGGKHAREVVVAGQASKTAVTE